MMHPVNRLGEPHDLHTRMTGISAVLFDLDGTLIDTMDHILASFRHATATVLGQALADDVLMHNVGIPLREQMLEFTSDETIAEELLLEYRRFNHACHDEMAKLYPGTPETLRTLRDRAIPMGIVTSKGTPMARKGLDLFELNEYFDVVVTSDDVTKYKPDPYPVLYAAELLGVSAEDCVYVGDSPHDMEAGRKAGAITVAVTWGVADRQRLEAMGPDVLIDSIPELLPLLLS